MESALIAPAPARRPYGVGINSQELLRFFATDFHMTEWTGAWFVPDVRFPDSGGRPVVSGKVSSIGARVPLGFGTHWKNSTGLYYAEKLPLPMQSVTETHVLRGSEVLLKRSNADHAKTSNGVGQARPCVGITFSDEN